jgi:oligopeptide/dipeptide ABC transporter ATP-binding protein
MEDKILEVRHLTTEFKTGKNTAVTAVSDVSFDLARGEILGLVGESGCGKSVTSLSIMGLFEDTAGRVANGEILFDGMDLTKIPKKQLREIRGKRISMIFQNPMSSLNSCMRVETQLIEAIRLHNDLSHGEARKRAFDMLAAVGIPDPEQTLRSYPHQLSGGMSQRVMIAMALCCEPEMMIADEPTTALDVTIQAQILELMKKIRDKNNTSILFITHDLGVVAEMCTRALVMYAGRIVEEASVLDLFASPVHPYTKGLLASMPRLGADIRDLTSIPGSVPDLSAMPKGCKFAPRCPYAAAKCREAEPELRPIPGANGRKCRCWLYGADAEKEANV